MLKFPFEFGYKVPTKQDARRHFKPESDLELVGLSLIEDLNTEIIIIQWD